jgi:hypothetical protein
LHKKRENKICKKIVNRRSACYDGEKMTLFSGRAPTFLAPETTVIFSGEAVAMRSEDGSRHDWMSRVVHDMMHSGKEYYFIKDIDLIYRGCNLRRSAATDAFHQRPPCARSGHPF